MTATPDDIGIKPVAWRVSNAGKVWNFRRTSSGGLGWRHAEPVYSDPDVRAALAAKDAEIEALRGAIANASAELSRLADNAYCKSLDTFSHRLCLGWEAKVKDGQFGASEFEAHAEANKFMGKHQGFSRAGEIVRAALKEHSNGNG